ncbi:hypothetical protein [Nostoc sp.]
MNKNIKQNKFYICKILYDTAIAIATNHHSYHTCDRRANLSSPAQ